MAKSWEDLAKTLKDDPWHNAALELTKKKEVDTGIVENIFRGIKKSSAVAPFVAPVQEEATTFGGRLSETAGELAGDIPAMSLGGTGGAMAGAALGSVLGPIGTGLGALLGGGAGALMAPTAIKSITREAQRGTPIVDAAGNIVSDIGKSAIIGGLTAGAGRIAGPLLGRVGGKAGERILSTGLGRGATELAGELGGMTYGQHLTGEEVTPEMLAQNLLTMGAMKGAHGIAGKLPLKRPTANIDINTIIGQPSPIKENAFQAVREHIGERTAKVYKSQVAWQERLAKAEEKGKFTPQQLEDMMYYRQRTGGPKEGDTFESVRERLPEHARTFVDKTIAEHLDNSLKEWNANPYTKDIHPREELKDIYLPGLYEGTPGDFDRALATLTPRFKISNPFANEKTFLTYNQALREAGLKPRYNNIIDLMKHYDKVMIKSAANAEFAAKLKKDAIVRPNSKVKYNAARKAGWVPFMDPFLRRFVAGKTAEGKLIFSKSELPALVNPEMAPALQGVFSKDAYKPDHPAWRYYDAVSDRLKSWAVHLPFVDKIPGFAESPWSLAASPFHTWTLMEHAAGDFGTKLFAGIKSGQELLKNTEATADAIKHGLQLQRGDVGTTKNYLFGKLQPSMKLGSYNKFVNNVINDLTSKGNPPDAAEIKNIKSHAANYANNLYGGQNWEIINWFNDKNNLKMARRATGYLDWSVSNIKNAAQVLGKGYQGQQARKMWARYGLAFLGTRAIIDAFNSSLVQTDKDKSALGIRLDPEKFMNNLTLVGQPGQRILFHLPDVDVNVLGYNYNPGRDEKGHKQFGHFGKSALEIYHYYQKPLSELFTKSNPVFQQLYKQVTGTTPSEYGPMMVQRGWKMGQPMPWGGEEGYKQALARAKEIALTTVPFSMRAEGWEQAAKKYTSSLLGMFPLNKGLTPFKAQERIAKALKAKDYNALKDIQATLKDNGYSLVEINKKIKSVRTDLLKKGELR
jgi:hypothetical protein